MVRGEEVTAVAEPQGMKNILSRACNLRIATPKSQSHGGYIKLYGTFTYAVHISKVSCSRPTNGITK
jgi:hypothetical protein